MEERKIKGFKESEVFDLYSFVCRFEKIKEYKKKKDLQVNCPEVLNDMEKESKNLISHRSNHKKWNPEDLKRTVLIVTHFYSIKKNCFAYDVLFHIRNSIAHGNISVDKNNLVWIRDFDLNDKPTANALIHIDQLKNIIKCINENIKL